MFSGCSSLISLPNISKWNTYNVKDMFNIYNECSSLISLPDISDWNFSPDVFSKCLSLIFLPDVSETFEDIIGLRDKYFSF